MQIVLQKKIILSRKIFSSSKMHVTKESDRTSINMLIKYRDKLIKFHVGRTIFYKICMCINILSVS